jgi:hypothetical protein
MTVCGQLEGQSKLYITMQLFAFTAFHIFPGLIMFAIGVVMLATYNEDKKHKFILFYVIYNLNSISALTINIKFAYYI